MTLTAPLTTAADALTPMSPKELEDLRSMMWLADVGHAPTMAVTMKRMLINIDELTTYATQVRRDTPHHHDRLLPCPRCKHVALWRVTTNEGEVLLVDSGPLPPGSPSSQTDTGDSNV